MATQLGLFNDALAELGQRELYSITEPTQARRTLERLWDAGVPKRCLEQGTWNFAIRAVKSTNDPTDPAFGFQFRHLKPSDWVRTYKISSQPEFRPPLDDFTDEGSYWYANVDELFIQYVSDHPSYGGNLELWPESFSRYVALYLATLAAPRLLPLQAAQNLLRGPQGLKMAVEQALRNAKTKDSSNQPPEFPPLGTWSRSRIDYYNPLSINWNRK